jgi:glutathione S-transferase
MHGNLQLYTFAISHFSEKARWALDFEGVPYEERRLVPGPHMLTTRRLARASSVPILRHGSKVVQGSSAILDYLEKSLGGKRLRDAEPAEQQRIRALEARADQAFGLGIQRIFYGALLPKREVVTDLWCQHGPSWARPFYRVAYPTVAAAVRRMYKTRPDAIERAKTRFHEAMEEMDRLLGAQPYLGGERFGRADLAVAALLAPMCRPPEHLMRWPATPPELADFVGSFEGRPTWNHVLRMYRTHRLA